MPSADETSQDESLNLFLESSQVQSDTSVCLQTDVAQLSTIQEEEERGLDR